MDSRNLQEINQKIFEQVTNIRGDDIACYLTKFTISADHPTTKKDHSHQMIFLRGKTSMVYLDQSYMHTANRNKSILRLVMEIAAENEMTIDTSEPVIGSFIPYSFPLAQRYDEKGERSAPSFYLTSQDPASLNIAFPLDGSSD